MDDSTTRVRRSEGETRREREWDPPIRRRESAYSRDSYRSRESSYDRHSRDSYRSRDAYDRNARSGSSYERSAYDRSAYERKPYARDSYERDSYRSRDSYREQPSYRERSYSRDTAEPAPRRQSAAPAPARRNPPRQNPQTPLQRIAPLLLIAGMLAAAVIVLIVLLTGGIGPGAAPQETPVPTAVPTRAPTVAPTAAPVATEAPAAPVEQAPAQPAAPAAIPAANMPTQYNVLSGVPQTDRLLGLPETPRVDDSYWDDVIFIGDSVSMKLTYFVMNERKDNPRLLGNAEFLTSANVSSRNALKDVTDTSLHPTYKGQKMSFEDAVAASGKKKVYIMLGLNDVGVSGINQSVENLMSFVKRIKDRNPDVLIFIQSATPRVTGDKPTTKELFEYNIRVYDLCLQLQDQGVYFVDVAYIFRDENGNLYPDYCSDLDSMALHFNNSACRLWIDFLYTHALV